LYILIYTNIQITMKDRVLFTIDQEVNEKLKELSKKNSINKSALINNLISKWIDDIIENERKK